jgi:hypothetical protein
MSLRKNRPKCSPTLFLTKLMYNLNCKQKTAPKFRLLLSFSKNGKSKQFPDRRKIAQSGHPGMYVCMYEHLIKNKLLSYTGTEKKIF